MRFLKIILITITLFFLNPLATIAQEEWDRIINLSGTWRFSIGDNAKWASKDYNDGHWEQIKVPSHWENEGFYGYDGYAWYRVSFDGKLLKKKNANYHLFLGYIDDIDEVFLNDTRIGRKGSFPPHYQTAYDTFRDYFLPDEKLNYEGENVIAVRVYDPVGMGGIASGKIGIYSNRDDNNLAINLRGQWEFKLTNQFRSPREHAERVFNDFQPDFSKAGKESGWESIIVPGHWEDQGYKHYDGGAIFKKNFFVPEDLAGEDLVLVLGKIDDFDKTYLNGKLIGTTTWFDSFRGYSISAEDVKVCDSNLIEIYVQDNGHAGGFTKGPVGILRQSEYTRFMRWRK